MDKSINRRSYLVSTAYIPGFCQVYLKKEFYIQLHQIIKTEKWCDNFKNWIKTLRVIRQETLRQMVRAKYNETE